MSVRDPDAGHAEALDQGVAAAGAGVADGDAPWAGCAAPATGASSGGQARRVFEDAVMVTRPAHAAVNDIMVRPTAQEQ
ncbi:hypothetical protein FB563_0022 [Streptomyces puniciscabiei]|uniref:Uncharacterized protein n=2 Tax=Streptomyces puniciscabiei TaxID=164348 RepID=A0A542U805_9ACTN|nr:hypothetical protein FB563_0022 [Streptomyces puniciscabiei]